MSDFYMKIQRVLELEQQKGYTNSAVSGGLENFTTYLENQKRSGDVSDSELTNILAFFQSYRYLSIPEREITIRNALTQLRAGEPLAFSTPSTSPTSTMKTTVQDPALYAGVQSIHGIGPRNVKYFEKLEVHTIYDLLRFYPRKYQDFSQLKTISQIVFGEEVTLTGLILGDIVNRKSKKGNLNISEAVLSDSTGTIKLTWFNQPFLKNQLKAGMAIVVSGKVDYFRGRFTMASPVWEILDKEQIHTNRIVPIYPGTAGLSQRQIRNVIKKNIDFWSTKIIEYLPETILQENRFNPIGFSVNQIHFPDTNETLRTVQNRFAFEEVFFLQLGAKFLKARGQAARARVFQYDPNLLAKRKEMLPYILTSAQEKAIAVILADISSNKPMNRLLQGDVGSGKTVVAKFAIEAVVDQGAQAAILAPTGILAEQHYTTISDLMTHSGSLKPDQIALLLGKTTAKERSVILQDLKNGAVKCLIGTHALLEEDVVFEDLELVIIDEQHRFGVNQRNTLKQKGENPHTLVMSATPIPRSLAITLFGDLDVTTIDELPPGRLPVKTTILNGAQRTGAYNLVREQIERGFQAFIVYPMIEEEEGNEEKSAIANQQRLQKDVFPDYQVGLLHGKMKSQEKDEIMQDFRDGAYDILVSTTVIEVGVDIPRATIVIIESANFFGLAQLHQIGRAHV